MKKLFAGFILLCVILSAWSFAHSLNKPFTLDETDITNRAGMVVAHGPKGPELVFGKNAGETMPHPPLYEYTIALLFRVFGETEIAARSFGVLCFALVGFFMAGIVAHLLRNEDSFIRQLGIWTGVGLYAVSPLLIQHSILIDADGAYTFLFLNLFVYLFLKLETGFSAAYIRSRFLLTAVLVVTYLSKEYTPFFLCAAMLAYRLLNRDWKKLLTEFALVFALGAGLAWCVWLIFTHFTGIDPWIFVRQQHAHRISKFEGEHLILRVLYRNLTVNLTYVLRWPVYWGSAPLHFLAAWAIGDRVVRFFKTRRLEGADYCFMTVLTIWIPYLLIKPSIDMMKYQHPVYPVMMAAALACLSKVSAPHAKELRDFFVKHAWVFAAGAAVMALLTLYYYRIGDYILILFDPRSSARWKFFLRSYYTPFLIAPVLAVAVYMIKKKFFKLTLLFALLFLIFPVYFALDLRQTASYTTSESWLNYGEAGLRETTEYLSKRVTNDMNVFVRKDMEYYLRARYNIRPKKVYDPIYFFDEKRLHEVMVQSLRGQPFEYLIWDKASVMANPTPSDIGLKILSFYKKEAMFGSFFVLRWDGDQKLRALVQEKR